MEFSYAEVSGTANLGVPAGAGGQLTFRKPVIVRALDSVGNTISENPGEVALVGGVVVLAAGAAALGQPQVSVLVVSSAGASI